MDKHIAQEAVQAILNCCRESLGPDLQAAYLFGSLVTGGFRPGESDINLLLVLADQADLHELRRAYSPIWPRYRAVLGRSPIVVRRSTLSRYLFLHPVLADHLQKYRRLLAGCDCLEQGPLPDMLEPLSGLAGELLAASAAVVPQLLQPLEGQRRLVQLRRLYRQALGHPAPRSAPAAELVEQLTQYVALRLADQQTPGQSDLPDWPVVSSPSGAPALLPQLQAIYEIEDRLILVLPDPPATELAGLIVGIDWPAVADSAGQHYFSLHVTTPNQLRLYLHYDGPAAQFLGRYSHAWGTDFLASLDLPIQKVVRDLARRPAENSAVALPHAYLTTGDDELPSLIHDFQNKLLNIYLQHELFSRIDGRPRAFPTQPLPERDRPSDERIAAILDQFDWWADYYFAALQPASAQPAS